MDDTRSRREIDIILNPSGPQAARANRLARELVTSRYSAEWDPQGHALFMEVLNRAMNAPADEDVHVHLSYLVAALAAVGAFAVIVGARVAAQGVVDGQPWDCALVIGEDAILRTVGRDMTERPVL